MDDGFEQEIREFKSVYCDETQLIAETLRVNFTDFITDPVLDVGAGFQAISVRAFPNHDITLLDKLEYDVRAEHQKWVTADFFDYAPPERSAPNTILFCHVLQYLDADMSKLHSKIASLNPKKIITVVNDNDGAFGDLISWARRHIPSANPEVDVPMTAIGYRLSRRAKLTATLSCPNFKTLAYQFGRLILDLAVDASRSKALEAQMRSALSEPTLSINQTIFGYER